MINSLAHLLGGRPNLNSDESRNVPVLDLFTLGEGLHNNHHHRPGEANFSRAWWQVDLGYSVIAIMVWFGLAQLRVETGDALP